MISQTHSVDLCGHSCKINRPGNRAVSNDTGNGVLITATRYSDGVVIEMWGTKKFDKVTSSFTDRYGFTGYQTIKDDSEGCVDSEGVQGFSISVTRRRYVDGEVVSTETWPTHYKPTPNVVCSNPTVVS